MAQSVTYLNFNGNCRQAMAFYQNCIGGYLELQPVGESPMSEHMRDTPPDHILHSKLENGNIVIMASDMAHGMIAENGNAYSICLVCDTEEEINRLFNNLSEGGVIIEKLNTAPWGAVFGMLVDKFDKNWMFNYTIQQV